MVRTTAYLRVSTDDQTHNGCSLAAQRAQAEAYATLYGLALVAVVEDVGASGRTLDRPGLHQALGMLTSGAADAVLVTKLDRLTRSVRDLGALLETHFTTAALFSVAEQIETRSAAGRLVLNVLTSVAQRERETISKRTKAVLAHKRAMVSAPAAYPTAWRWRPMARPWSRSRPTRP